MPRLTRSSSLIAPPLAYAGEREALRVELGEIIGKLKRCPDRSPFRPALQKSFTRITARLLALGDAPAPVPGADRRDLQ